MLDNKNLRKERFIQMVTEASELFYEFYPDFGKFTIILDDKDPINALINNDSEIDRPKFSVNNKP